MTKRMLCLTENLAFSSTEPFTTGYIPLKYIRYFNITMMTFMSNWNTAT